VDAVVIAQQVPLETYITDLIRTDDNGSDEGTRGDTDEDTGEDEDDEATDSVSELTVPPTSCVSSSDPRD
jgi:hypothetical protein